MTRTDGEHELVLGNKQLLSAFFVVVILLGVFFTMGYFVGKNTATAGFNSGQSTLAGGSRPDAAGKPLDAGDGAVPSGSTPGSDSGTTPAANSTLPPGNVIPPSVPASQEPKPVETKPAETRREEAKREEAKRPSTPAANDDFTDKPEKLAQPSSEEMYLQVSAIRRPDADNMVRILKDRGFPALLGESSKQGLYRVLVGPFKSSGEMGRKKAELKAKGFDSIVAK